MTVQNFSEVERFFYLGFFYDSVGEQKTYNFDTNLSGKLRHL